MLDPESSLADSVLRLVGSRWRVNQFTYLEEDIGFIYLAAPAAANIRTIGSLQKGVAHVRGEGFEINNLRKITNRDESLIANPKELGFDVFDQMLRDESVIKLAFVRDPVERFAAVYRNHFSINVKNGAQRVKLFAFLGMPLEENLTMLDLAELLNEEESLKDLSPPLMLQRSLIAFDLIDYQFIGRHERWREDYAHISMEVFGCETPTFDPVKDLNIDPEGQKLFSLVDEEIRAELEEAYAEDYEMIAEIEELFPDGFAAA
ncbi:MAG TPA: hypothetical protein EYG79_05360 [Rhodobacteraceae bacterium]|nr:hypothetical protein [Paracoccaceae bacterium]